MILQLFHFTQDEGVYIDNPPLSQVMEVVEALDGDEYDTVGVMLHNGDSMEVGGGNDGQYVCNASIKGVFHDLVDPQRAQDMHDTVVIMMNQEGNTYPRCCIVSREMVMVAIECFCTSGKLASSLTWTDELEYDPL